MYTLRANARRAFCVVPFAVGISGKCPIMKRDRKYMQLGHARSHTRAPAFVVCGSGRHCFLPCHLEEETASNCSACSVLAFSRGRLRRHLIKTFQYLPEVGKKLQQLVSLRLSLGP